MDIEKFLELLPDWAQSPALYIVRQMATENPGAHRCGASGTFLQGGAETSMHFGSGMMLVQTQNLH